MLIKQISVFVENKSGRTVYEIKSVIDAAAKIKRATR